MMTSPAAALVAEVLHDAYEALETQRALVRSLTGGDGTLVMDRRAAYRQHPDGSVSIPAGVGLQGAARLWCETTLARGRFLCWQEARAPLPY